MQQVILYHTSLKIARGFAKKVLLFFGFFLPFSGQLHRDDLLGRDLHDQLAVGEGQVGLNGLVQIGESRLCEGGGDLGGEGHGLVLGVVYDINTISDTVYKLVVD